MSPNADIQISAISALKKCLPIADMPILKNSADIADADINIGTLLLPKLDSHEGARNPCGGSRQWCILHI